jgi:purine-cytosine permease-like protein
MPLFIGCLALAFPRAAIVLVWLFGGNYLSRAYDHWIWPFLGFLFLPLTTLAFAFGLNTLGTQGQMPPLGWLLVGLAAAADLGLMGGGHRAWRGRRDD